MYDMSWELTELDDAFSWSFLSDDLLSFYHGKSHHWTEKNSLYFNQTVEEAILHSLKLTLRPGKIGGWEVLGDYSIFLFREKSIFGGYMIFKQVIFLGLCSF